MLPPEDRELLKSSRKASVSAPSPFQRPYFGSANAAEHRASSSAPKLAVKPHPVKSGFTKDPHPGSANAAEHRALATPHPVKSGFTKAPYSGSANAAEHRALTRPHPAKSGFTKDPHSSSANAEEYRVLATPHPVKSGFTKGSYSGSANAAEHRQILNVQKEDQAVKKVQLEQQRRLAGIPNYRNAAVNSEMREAIITQVHQDALKDPAYRSHEARIKRETDLSLKVQRDRALQEHSKQQPQEKKHWWDKATDFVKDHSKDIGHGALDAAGFIPVVGGVADLANAGWYLAEGDKTNAALSAAAAVPFAGDAVAATAIGAKIAVKTAVAAKGVHLASAAVGGIKADKAIGKAEKAKTYITYSFRNSDDVVHYVGRASGKGTPREVLMGRIERGHDIAKNFPDLKPHIEGVQGSKAANKGAEDVLYSRNQIRNPSAVDGKKMAPGASETGKQLLNRTNTMSNKPWIARTTGRKNISEYAKDLRE